MRIAVVGLWHLGSVTAACLASAGHDVIGFDLDAAAVSGLAAGRAPLFEPGLDALVRSGLTAGCLRFTTDAARLIDAELVWITFDTPVDDNDRADVGCVTDKVIALFPYLRHGSLVLISSQLPVGTTRRIEQSFAPVARGRAVGFAYSPENLRLGQAIGAFSHPDRVVVGVRSTADRARVAQALAGTSNRIEWMSVESAEMTKHALNAFLATSVAFINETAALCEQVGADAGAVERGLKSDARIGARAYLSPGGAFAGGTLARDLHFLSSLGAAHEVPTPLLSSVASSNAAHRLWAARRLDRLLGGVAGKTVAIWGLTYKPGTDTLRRSIAVDLCRGLIAAGANVRAHDVAVRAAPDLGDRFALVGTPLDAASGASALVVATPWPEYALVAAADVAGRMTRPLVLDANRFTKATLGAHAGIQYVSVGQGGA